MMAGGYFREAAGFSISGWHEPEDSLATPSHDQRETERSKFNDGGRAFPARRRIAPIP
jgi:hypothetical protein